MITFRSFPILALGVQLALGPAVAAAQRADAAPAGRPLSSRADLEALARQLEGAGGTDRSASGRLARIRTRLAEGDFRPGDRIRLAVERESTLTDTFTVEPDRSLRLPSPVAEPLPLSGVLRAELEPKVSRFLAKFLVNAAKVQAWPLLRLSVQGEVLRAGIHDVPADAQLADVLRAAGGTTTDANMRKLKIERDGKAIWKGEALDQALADGRSVSEADLQSGDQIVVPRLERRGLEGSMSFLWVIVSLAGGVYGLSRAF